MSTAQNQQYIWTTGTGEEISGDRETFTAYLQDILDTFGPAELRSLQDIVQSALQVCPDVQNEILLSLIPETLKKEEERWTRLDLEEEYL